MGKIAKHTVFISWKVLINLPSHDCSKLTAIDSISNILFLIVSGMNAVRTSFLNLVWYSPCWKKMACFPNILSLLAGNVGLKRWAFDTSTSFASSGLDIITQGHPNMWDLKIEPYLFKIKHQPLYAIKIIESWNNKQRKCWRLSLNKWECLSCHRHPNI